MLRFRILGLPHEGERCDPSVRHWFSVVAAEDLDLRVLVVGEIHRGIALLRRRDTSGATALDRWLREIERRDADPFCHPHRRTAGSGAGSPASVRSHPSTF